MTTFRRNDIMVLLGAGASIEAGIPHSAKMTQEVERLIADDRSAWSEYRSLYYFVRSSIYYLEGIHGRFPGNVNYNIERLVNTLDELSKRDQHTLFPFVGSWTPKLPEVAGANFEAVAELKQMIVQKLRAEWITLESAKSANYFKELLRFQKEFQHPLRVFTLNYDLCVEQACGADAIERGFGEQEKWDWRLFDDNQPDAKPILLYKLHGSNDWKYDDNGYLTYVHDHSRIQEAAIIFGTVYKLQYIDPFLFFAYEFRRWTLEARLIVAIGYGFGDDHINGMIKQSLNSRPECLLLCVSPSSTDERRQWVADTLGVKNVSQIHCRPYSAKAYLEGHLRIDEIADLFPDEEDDLLPEVPVGHEIVRAAD